MSALGATLAATLFAGTARQAAEPPISALAFAPGGAEVLVGSQAGLVARAWPPHGSGREIDGRSIESRSIQTELAHVHDVAFAPDGGSFAAVGGQPGFEGVLEVRAWPAGELLARRDLTSDLLYAVAWSPGGRALACTGHGGEVLLVDPVATRAPRSFEGHLSPVLAVAFTADGSVLVTAGADRSLRVWDIASGTCTRVLSNHTGAVRGLATRPSLGPGPPLVASIGDDRTLRLWQPTIGRLVRFARLPAEPLALAWSADASLVYATARDGQLYAVDPQAVSVVGSAPACDGWAYSLAVGPNDSDPLAVGGADGHVHAAPAPLPERTDDP